ncbi:MAG: hypothetical protein BWX80_03663 [Candidatus Hydrogenedentes bacterium ADurb.Bin101]|nr:MAG: hypothetical protein BWX80_03663 [Candidatus Hydrogenedentes bacterium ADurb.Bin101]
MELRTLLRSQMKFGNERGGNDGAVTSGMEFWNESENRAFLQALLTQVRHTVIRQPVLWPFGAPGKVRLLST